MHGNIGIGRQEGTWELGLGQRRTRRDGIHDFRRHEDNEFSILPFARNGLKQLAEDRNIADKRDLRQALCLTVVEQPSNSKTLPLAQLYLGLDPAHRDRGYVEARDLNRISEVESTDLGRDLKADGSARHDGGDEVETDPISLN